jgi:hypothetical protein
MGDGMSHWIYLIWDLIWQANQRIKEAAYLVDLYHLVKPKVVGVSISNHQLEILLSYYTPFFHLSLGLFAVMPAKDFNRRIILTNGKKLGELKTSEGLSK